LPKLPVLDAKTAEAMLLKVGYVLVRSKGSHRIYMKEKDRFVIPFHSGKSLHPKIVRQLIDIVGVV